MKGWECPRCGRCYSPLTSECGSCNNPFRTNEPALPQPVPFVPSSPLVPPQIPSIPEPFKPWTPNRYIVTCQADSPLTH